jgi:membrane fusion protein (multidrug efflux system)
MFFISLQSINDDKKMSKRLWIPICLLVGLLLAVGLFYSLMDDEDDEEQDEEYRTLTIKLQDYTVTRELTAKIETENPAAIRPQVSGKITKICVKEGAHVKKGQPLFIIDQAPYQAAVRNAEAKVVSAKAQLATARQNLEGKEELYRQHVVGEFDLNKARNAKAEAEGALAEAQADLETARSELSYTVITSPSDGVLSMIEYRLGELVDPSMETELTNVTDPRRLFAYFSMSEKTIHNLADIYNCRVSDLLSVLPEVSLVTYWGKELSQKGRITAISGNVDEATGSFVIRASFENSEDLFRNGSNGTIILPYELKNTIVIPQEATYDILNKQFVYKVVDGVTKACEIKVLRYDDGKDYVVTEGLKPGDVIIAEGAGMVKDGMRVKVK